MAFPSSYERLRRMAYHARMAAGEIEHVDAPIVEDGERLPRDPMAALDKLTQLNIASVVVAAHACGAVSLLAATLATRGYAGLAALTESLRALGGFAEIIHRRYRGFDGGMPYERLLHLMREAGFQPPRVIDNDDVGRTVARAGECWPVR